MKTISWLLPIVGVALPAAAGVLVPAPSHPSPTVHYPAALRVAQSAAGAIGVEPGGLSFISVTGSIPQAGPMHYNFAAVDAAGEAYQLVSVAVHPVHPESALMTPSIYRQALPLSQLSQPQVKPGQLRSTFSVKPAAGLDLAQGLPDGLPTPEQALAAGPYNSLRMGIHWRSSFSLGFSPQGVLRALPDGSGKAESIIPWDGQGALLYTFFDDKGNVAVYDPKTGNVSMHAPNPRR